MEQPATNLQQLKGIGRVLARRLQDAGLDNFAKIVQAGEQELSKIKGIDPLKISSILNQAKLLAEVEPAAAPAAAEVLQQRLVEVKEQVHTLAEASRERFAQELEGKSGKKLVLDLARIDDALGLISFKGKKKIRRAGKALKRVQKRVAGLAADAGLKKVRKTLKRARKAVLKAVK